MANQASGDTPSELVDVDLTELGADLDGVLYAADDWGRDQEAEGRQARNYGHKSEKGQRKN